VPISAGGGADVGNYAIQCEECHHRVHDDGDFRSGVFRSGELLPILPRALAALQSAGPLQRRPEPGLTDQPSERGRELRGHRTRRGLPDRLAVE